MTVAQLIEPLELTLLTPGTDLERAVKGGCVCDLLSYVMANGDNGMAWITVQTHLNVIAVASLHEFACVILSDGSAADEPTLAKAAEEGIPVLSSPLAGYTLAGRLYALGIR
ncbi:MAG: AraC family transcriptional regulator [Christensenellaceae bacterium]|jgi:hypothetical protein|nr:AraC family transcriptional regulator [Christensenellaceae bacterium]